jgi:hypothetical protein
MISTPNPLLTSGASVPLECVCCGERLSQREHCCEECQTPTSVSRAVAARAQAQSFISVLGASNAGKTVYLGLLLDMLSNGSDSLRGSATGAFSIELQEQVITALERRSFPEKTPSEADAWKWFHCQISMAEKKKTRYVDMISPDFAGEAIAMEINHAGMYPSIGHVVSKSGGLMILCDSMRVRDAGSGEDLFAMKLASYIAQQQGLETDNGRRRSSGPAVAIVFTKSDGCPEAIEDPAQFASNNTPRLFEFCRRMFTRHSFFAASVAGSSGVLADTKGRKMRVPFHIQPYGIVEPLKWIVSQS